MSTTETPDAPAPARAERPASQRRLIIGAVIVAAAALYFSGRMDPAMSHVGLNWTECVQNGYGATFCGDNAKAYQQQVRQTEQEINEILGDA